MSIKIEFCKHQDIWDDCYLGYVICENNSKNTGQEAIKAVIERDISFNFYPWLNETESISLPKNGLIKISRNEFENIFFRMAQEAVSYGSDKRLLDREIKTILDSFITDVDGRDFYSNCTHSGWRPVTLHSRDNFLCVVGKHKIGMWLSCDDE
ncbi:hypothetical protein [Microbulbifer sp. PAAF003]|uniref:hypothetical protein n=1 Tax=Microbulbifer sp. PAAF003 TaxID=3243375 RepID=UPI004038FC0B